MRLTGLELTGFKSFAKKTNLAFDVPITAIVGPNGSGKSNIAEACRWVLGEQSLKSLRGRRGEDFIWNGGGRERANRAAVQVTFDNHNHKFPLDYDEVAIGREVHRDGTNIYTINRSAVRLRDVTALLNAVSLGASGYHIMSQGEADRLLSASGVERRQMIEDALGLKIYQSQIIESEKKLEKTNTNLREAELLRREIAPHLRFLKKEMEKIERSQTLRAELKSRGLEYFAAEARYLAQERQTVEKAAAGPQATLVTIIARLTTLEREKGGTTTAVESPLTREIRNLDERLYHLAEERNEINRAIGRLEGQVETLENVARSKGEETVPKSEVAILANELETTIAGAEVLGDLILLRAVLVKIAELGQRLKVLGGGNPSVKNKESGETMEKLKIEREKLNQKLTRLADEFVKLETERQVARRAWEAERETRQGAEREIFELKLKQAECQAERAALAAREETLARDEARFQTELNEAVLLTDRELLRFAENRELGKNPSRDEQETARRQIERLKIQLEDMGVEGGDIITEYAQVSERDTFLARETEDLIKSIASLQTVLRDLKEKCAVEFEHGLEKISRQFQEFFAVLFDGGTAALQLTVEKAVKEDGEETSIGDGENDHEDQEEVRGVEVSVNLPRKRIRGLEMLSGGERALTSIALLFAMSQVNPPPFLILDETDAALDEANSRRYGEMVETLARHSQLILITHNRETMSHAGVIYGVTMGNDGVSRLLSIKLDQAVEYAKT